MDVLKVAVCDDDDCALDGIAGAAEAAFRRHGEQAAVERFHSMRQLNERMKEQRFDLLLLDIDMPKVDGIRFGLYLRENKDRTEIVYVSNREDRVFESFQVPRVKTKLNFRVPQGLLFLPYRWRCI